MQLTLLHYLIVCPLVFLGGLVDAIAGGGGLITMPAYLIAGLPAHSAVATNKLSSSMGTTVSTVRYAKAGFISLRYALCGIPAALLGSSLGARLALHIDERIFKFVLLILLPCTAAYLLFSKRMERQREPFSVRKTALLVAVFGFAIGVYDGFYGPGTGTFLILLLTGAARMELKEANGISKAINMASNYAAITVYLFSGRVLIPLGLAAGVFCMAGNYVGTKLFGKRGAGIARPVMLGVLFLFFVRVVLELLGVL